MLTPKFKFGQSVCSKRLGLPSVGFICGINTPQAAALLKNATTKEKALEVFPMWTEFYPDWSDKLIYNVQFDTPQKVYSLIEYCKCLGIISHPLNEVSIELKTECYNQACPTSYILSYPEDDLEVFE